MIVKKILDIYKILICDLIKNILKKNIKKKIISYLDFFS